ncbi:RL112 [Hepatospora eriocheir]|uniref:RL112 n=1 Tax=Hepatospora eriocheir TaxID=1081669 RepID=A0A1X0QKK8_9MICR|nr:RL112 [Hepatospora eriocheir]
MNDQVINKFREVRIQKLCINSNIKPKNNELDKCKQVLKQISGQEPFTSKSKYTIRGWGIRRNERISASVTVKGKKAKEILLNALKVKELTLPESCFSDQGNFGFGIEEHIDLGIKYDPSIGIFGMNFYVVLDRPGSRVAKRRRCKSRIGKKQRVTKEDGMKFFTLKLNGEISN